MDIMPFIGRENELGVFQDVISRRDNNCILIYGGPGIGKSRLLKRFEEKAQEEGFNIIYYSPNQHHDELSFLYQMGTNIQKILMKKHSQSRLHQSLLQKSRLKRRKIESVSLSIGSIAAGALFVPLGVGLTVASIIRELKDSNIQNIEHIAILMELLIQDLEELAEKDQKTIILLDDCHKLRNFEAFDDMIAFISQRGPDTVYFMAASRRKFRNFTGIQMELLEFLENELQMACQVAFPQSNVAELMETSFGHPYIMDRLFRIKTIPKISLKDKGIEAAIDYVDAEYIQSLSKEELEFLEKISPLEDITYESAAAVTQETYIPIRKLMQNLITCSLLSYVGRRDILSREKVYKIHDIFQQELYRHLDDPVKLHGILADFYSTKMKAVTSPGQELYYLRLNLHHLRKSSPEGFVSQVRKTVDIRKIFDILGQYKEALDLSIESLDLARDLETEGYLLLCKGYYQEMLGKTEDAKISYQKAIDEFTEIGHEDGLACSLHQRANIFETEGQYELAEAYYKESMIISEKIGDIKGYSESIHQSGMLCYNRGKYKETLEYLDRSIELSHRVKEVSDWIISMEFKVEVLRQMGLYDEAKNLISQALALSLQNEYLEGEAYALNVLADIELEKGNYSESHAHNQESEKIYYESGDIVGMMMCEITKGRILGKLGEYVEALRVLENGLAYSRMTKDVRRESNVLRWIGDIYLKKGDYENASRYFAESLSISERLGDLSGIGAAFQCLGILSLEKGDSGDAAEKLKKSVKILRELGEKPNAFYSMYWIGKSHEKKGDNKEALRVFQKCLRWCKKASDRKGMADSIFLIGEIYRKNHRLSLGLRKMMIALGMYREMGCKSDIAKTFVGLARTRKAMGEKDEAFKLLQEASEMAEMLEIPNLREETLKEINALTTI